MTLDEGSDFKLMQTPAHHQHFGTTVDRFPKQKRKMDIPFYDIKKVGHERKLRTGLAPFACGDMRFRKWKVDNVPGPGTYKAQTITHELSRKPWGKKGIFGSSERRFVIKRSNIEKEEGPGPGSYNDMDAVKNLEAKKKASHK